MCSAGVNTHPLLHVHKCRNILVITNLMHSHLGRQSLPRHPGAAMVSAECAAGAAAAASQWLAMPALPPGTSERTTDSQMAGGSVASSAHLGAFAAAAHFAATYLAASKQSPAALAPPLSVPQPDLLAVIEASGLLGASQHRGDGGCSGGGEGSVAESYGPHPLVAALLAALPGLATGSGNTATAADAAAPHSAAAAPGSAAVAGAATAEALDGIVSLARAAASQPGGGAAASEAAALAAAISSAADPLVSPATLPLSSTRVKGQPVGAIFAISCTSGALL